MKPKKGPRQKQGVLQRAFLYTTTQSMERWTGREEASSNMNGKRIYLSRAIFCVLLIAVGLYGAVAYFPKGNLREPPVSVHLLTSGELDGRYLSISMLRVIPGFLNPLYVEVPLADGTVERMIFSGSKEEKEKILQLQHEKDLEQEAQSITGGGRSFLSVDYTGVYQAPEFREGAPAPIVLGEHGKYGILGIVLTGFGLCGLIAALLHLLRKPKLVPLFELQSVYSQEQLERILRERPIYWNIWLTDRGLLWMTWERVTQVNFHDITGIDLEQRSVNRIRTYAIQLINRQEAVAQMPNFESRDIAEAFARYLMAMAPRAEVGATLQAFRPAPQSPGQTWDAALRQQAAQDFHRMLQEAKGRHRKEIVSIGTVGALLVGGLVLLAGTGLLLPKFLRRVLLTGEVDALGLLDAVLYSAGIPLVLCGILSVILMVWVIRCLRRSGSYARGGAIASLLLGSTAILIGFLGVLSDVSFQELKGAVADKRQIQKGALTETEVRLTGGGPTDAETLPDLTEEAGYTISRLNGIPVDGNQEQIVSYYFPDTVDLTPYETAGTAIFRIQHTEHWNLILDITAAE